MLSGGGASPVKSNTVVFLATSVSPGPRLAPGAGIMMGSRMARAGCVTESGYCLLQVGLPRITGNCLQCRYLFVRMRLVFVSARDGCPYLTHGLPFEKVTVASEISIQDFGVWVSGGAGEREGWKAGLMDSCSHCTSWHWRRSPGFAADLAVQ